MGYLIFVKIVSTHFIIKFVNFYILKDLYFEINLQNSSNKLDFLAEQYSQCFYAIPVYCVDRMSQRFVKLSALELALITINDFFAVDYELFNISLHKCNFGGN